MDRAARPTRAVLAAAIGIAALTSCAHGVAHHVGVQTGSRPVLAGSADGTVRASSGPVPSALPGRVRTLPSVGPLFTHGAASDHRCNAAVVDSPRGDVILTAAHCVSGSGAGIVFAPGYAGGATPYGRWVVQRAYAATGWLAAGDASFDYAFLIVKPQSDQSQSSVESVVGGNSISVAPEAGQQITLVAYVAGRNDDPVICAGTVYSTDGYPSVDCPGYANGTSGGPWLSEYGSDARNGTITAVIGGLRAGGCTPDTSYSSRFTPAIFDLLLRAEAGGSADTLPVAGSAGC